MESAIFHELLGLTEKREHSKLCRGMPGICRCAAQLQGLDDPLKPKKHPMFRATVDLDSHKVLILVFNADSSSCAH